MTAAEVEDEVVKIGMRIQEQSNNTLFQEQTRKEQQDRTMEQLSQWMQAKVDSMWRQAVNATQLAVQAQSVVQFASMIVLVYEQRMNEV